LDTGKQSGRSRSSNEKGSIASIKADADIQRQRIQDLEDTRLTAASLGGEFLFALIAILLYEWVFDENNEDVDTLKEEVEKLKSLVRELKDN